MARDEHGMPVPSDESPLPWHERMGGIKAANGDWVLEEEFLCEDDLEFAVHAANWIIPCREIVRRLANWSGGNPSDGISPRGSIFDLANDAANLWAKMQEEAKGGVDNGEG